MKVKKEVGLALKMRDSRLAGGLRHRSGWPSRSMDSRVEVKQEVEITPEHGFSSTFWSLNTLRKWPVDGARKSSFRATFWSLINIRDWLQGRFESRLFEHFLELNHKKGLASRSARESMFRAPSEA